MPFVIVAGERYALPIGETVLGGGDETSLAVPELTRLPALASVSVRPDHVATVRRIGSQSVRLNGVEIGPGALPLSHGSVVELAGVRILFGDIRESGRTSMLASVNRDDLLLLGSLASEPTADTGGRLLLGDGRAVPIPDTGLVIGRDPECGLVVTGSAASRRHATIAPSLQGYTLTDHESANGTLINGRRVDGAQVLGFGDRIRIGDTELRFEADRASYEPAVAPEPAPVAPGVVPGARTPTPTPRPGRPILATLEIINEDAQKGTRFRIEQPLVYIGRGEHNDVRLNDGSVSGSHATLTRQGTAWVLRDLDSTNGTWADGTRVTGEHTIAGVAELRFGNRKLLFRTIGGSGTTQEAKKTMVARVDVGTRKGR